jgi:hypothetical protein
MCWWASRQVTRQAGQAPIGRALIGCTAHPLLNCCAGNGAVGRRRDGAAPAADTGGAHPCAGWVEAFSSSLVQVRERGTLGGQLLPNQAPKARRPARSGRAAPPPHGLGQGRLRAAAGPPPSRRVPQIRQACTFCGPEAPPFLVCCVHFMRHATLMATHLRRAPGHGRCFASAGCARGAFIIASGCVDFHPRYLVTSPRCLHGRALAAQPSSPHANGSGTPLPPLCAGRSQCAPSGRQESPI